MEDILFHAATVATSAILGYGITKRLIPVVANHLLTRTNLNGVDMGKKDRPRLPESLGIVVGLTYLFSFVLLFVITPLILVSFNVLNSFSLSEKLCISTQDDGTSGYNNSLSIVAAITSVTAMLLLGFFDDCYDLRWRYKLMFPFAASVPLLSVYYYNYRDRTTVLVPQFLSRYFNLETSINLGIFYYIFMLMFVIFCTNAINIYSGINGLEVGQSIVLSITIILYNIVEIRTRLDCDEVHVLSLQILIPFLFCSIALYQFNRYPAKVFVGDSYCYFAGMTLAVVGILGHFSEEILLFSIPQVFNFLLSVPQLFKFLPCPRHRLPNFNKETGLREPSEFKFKYSELNILGRLLLKIYSMLGFARVQPLPPSPKIDDDSIPNDTIPPQSVPEEQNSELGLLTQRIDEQEYSSNNLTLINLWLCWFGPKSERDLCHQLLRLQSSLSFIALAFLTVKMHNE